MATAPGAWGRAESRGGGEVKKEKVGKFPWELCWKGFPHWEGGGDFWDFFFFFSPVSLRVSPRLLALLMVERC